MQGIVEELLRLEGAKQTALIDGNAPAYDESVRAQLNVLDSACDLEAAARASTDKLRLLSTLIQQNTALFLNRIATSPVFQTNNVDYTANGTLSPRVESRIAVEA